MSDPEVSIVLLTRNGGDRLRVLLEAVCAQETRRTVEIVAVDSESTDNTLETLRAFGARIHPIPLAEFNFGLTRDLGYRLARGRYLVTLSQDSVPASTTWLEQLLAPFDDPTVAAVAGPPHLPPRPARVLFWERIDRFYFTRESKRWIARYHFGYSNVNSALRKSVWEQHPIGPCEMCEDRLLQKKWTALGLRLVFAPGAAVYHGHDYDLRDLTRRCENEGLGLAEVGLPYSLFDCICDMLSLPNWFVLFASILRGARPTRAELLFLLIRPFFLWKGRRWTRRYVRDET